MLTVKTVISEEEDMKDLIETYHNYYIK